MVHRVKDLRIVRDLAWHDCGAGLILGPRTFTGHGRGQKIIHNNCEHFATFAPLFVHVYVYLSVYFFLNYLNINCRHQQTDVD